MDGVEQYLLRWQRLINLIPPTDNTQLPAPGIFLIQNDGQLLELTESPYDSEAILQELIAKHPSLLAGDQVDTERPRRWLLCELH